MPGQGRNDRWILGGIIIAALVVRLAAARFGGSGTALWFPDSADYNALGQAILHGEPYRIPAGGAVRMPGYPVLIAAVYLFTGPHVQAVLLVQAFLGAACCILVYRLGRQISSAAGLIAAGLVALDPLSIGFGAALLSEIPFTFMLLLGLCLAAAVARRRDDGAISAQGLPGRPVADRGWLWVVAGLVWAAAVYLRASAIGVAVLVIAASAVLACRARRCAFVGGFVTLAVLLGMLLPWWLRNERVLGGPFGRMTSLEGISLYEAVYPGADGGPRQDVILRELPPTERARLGAMTEGQRDVAWRQMAWREIAAHPGRVAGLAIIKIARMWSPWFNAAGFQRPWLQAGMALWHVAVYALAAAGLVSRCMPRPILLLLGLTIMYFTALHALFLGSVRYRVPLMPIVELAAAAGIVSLWDVWKRRQPRSRDGV